MPRPKPTPDVSFLKTTPAPAAGSPLFAAGVGATVPAGDLPLDRLENNPYQPEDRGNPAQVTELAEVMGRQGFHGKLLARPHPTKAGYYQLAFGHQRREAAQEAGLRHVPVEVRDLSDQDMIEYIITENIHRQDLTPLQEAATYRLMEAQLGLTHEQIAERVGKSRAYVTKALGFLTAPDDVRQLLQERPNSFRAASELKAIADPGERETLIEAFRAGEITTNDIATRRRELRQAPPPPVASPGVPPPAVPPAARPVPAAETETPPDNRAAERAGLARLGTALESLNRYAQQAAERGDISLAEYTRLCEVRALADRLCDEYRPLDAEPAS